MATLYITEFALMGQVPNSAAQMPQQPPLAEQTVTIGASTQSAAFNAKTRFVRLHTDAICSVEFGTNPTATAANARLAANQTEFHGVPEGGAFKVAVITNS